MKNKTIASCAKCPLRYNQKPLLDHEVKTDVMWVGLSAKKVENVEVSKPLDEDTSTGKLVADIEKECFGVKFFKTNLVKCLPLNKNGKIRYPLASECSSCFANLLIEIQKTNPSIVILLGNKVTNFVFERLALNVPKLSYTYEAFKHDELRYVPIHHPSYIAVYKRKEKEQYIQSVKRVIEQIVRL